MPNLAQEVFEDRARRAMKERKVTRVALAKKWGKHRNSIYLAIKAPAALPDLHRRIARHLGLEPEL